MSTHQGTQCKALRRVFDKRLGSFGALGFRLLTASSRATDSVVAVGTCTGQGGGPNRTRLRGSIRETPFAGDPSQPYFWRSYLIERVYIRTGPLSLTSEEDQQEDDDERP